MLLPSQYMAYMTYMALLKCCGFIRHPLKQAKRCLREIKLLKMLDHENVIELFQATALSP